MVAPLVLIGASGHAKVVADIVMKAGRYNVVGFLDESKQIGDVVAGLPVIGKTADIEKLFREGVAAAIVAIGDNSTRSIVYGKVKALCPDMTFATAVHPSASVSSDVEIGDGTVVMAGAVINAATRIGVHCIVNSRASVDHDCVIGDFSSIAPGVTIGGNVRVGSFSTIAIGAIVKHNVAIGDETVIGAGSLVLTNVPANLVSYGREAAAVRRRQHGDRYL